MSICHMTTKVIRITRAFPTNVADKFEALFMNVFHVPRNSRLCCKSLSTEGTKMMTEFVASYLKYRNNLS